MSDNRYQAYGYCFRVERVGSAYMAVGRAAGRGQYVLDRLGCAPTPCAMQAILDAWAKRNNIQPIKQQMCKQQGAVVCKTQH